MYSSRFRTPGLALPILLLAVTLAPSSAADARGWVGLEERNVWGLTAKNPTADYGLDALGGLWLLGEHVQPIVDIGWSRVTGSSLHSEIDLFRAGGRVAIGSALDERLWLGGTVGVVAEAGWHHDAAGSASTSPVPSAPPSLAWAASPAVSLLVQGRIGRRIVLGGELGVEHSIPALEWGTVSIFRSFRLQLGLEIGIILGEPVSG